MTLAPAGDTDAVAAAVVAERTCTLHWLGRVPYGAVLQLQEWLVEERAAARCGDTILLLEHETVVTLGRGAKRENLRMTESELRERGVAFFETARGGDVTLHGPGQLVAYPIVDLKPDRCDVRRYVRDLARVMAALARDYGVVAELLDEYIGIWVNPETMGEFHRDRPMAKLGAIGVRLSRWVTMHGFALNVTSHPGTGEYIVPCGLQGYAVTSLAELTGRGDLDVERLARASAPAFAEALATTPRFATAEETTALWAACQAAHSHLTDSQLSV